MIGVQPNTANTLPALNKGATPLTAQLEFVPQKIRVVHPSLPDFQPVAPPITASAPVVQLVSSSNLTVPANSTIRANSTVPAAAEPILNEAGYFPIEQLDAPPRLLGEVEHIYPARARAAEVEGFVTVALLINEHGELDEITVTKEQPPGYFNEAALTMLRNQRFAPALKQNQAVKSRWVTTVRYRLQGSDNLL